MALINPIFTYNTLTYDDVPFKKISSSVDMVETVISEYMSLHYDLDLEDSKPIFSLDTVANDGIIPS